MAWGDEDPALTKPKTVSAKSSAGFGDDDAAVTRPGGRKKKTDQGLGFMKGVMRPLDNAAYWLESGLDKIGVDTDAIERTVGGALPFVTDKGVKELMDERAAIVRRKAEQGVRPGLVGEVAGNIVGTIPAAFATRNPYIVGAAQGALTSENPDDAMEVALNAGGGALLNKAAGAVTDKAIDILKPAVSPAVTALQKAGVRMTPGQIGGAKALAREDRLMSAPVVGPRIAADRAQFVDDFNRGAVNRSLLPLGKRLPDDIATGHDAVAFMQQTVGDAYDNLLPKMRLKADPRLAVGIRSGWTTAQDLSEEGQKRFATILQNKLRFSDSGELSGRSLTVAMRDLRDLAAGFSRGSSEDERILGAALAEVHDGLQSSLAAQNPGFAKALQATNKAYRDSLVVTRAASMADDGVAGTGQFKTASRAVDMTKGKRATGAGRGPMQDYVKAGREVTGKTPNSGTAERLLEGSWVAKARGAVDAAGYEASKAMSALRTAPRPAVMTNAAKFLADHKVPLQVVGGPVLGGLLAGIFANE